MVRSEHDASGASGAIEPLADVGRLLPSGVTNVAGGGPSHGASTRTSIPILRSSRARPITCACTPPGNDRLYGQTIATRSSLPIGRGPSPPTPDSATARTLPDLRQPPGRHTVRTTVGR